jgi:hypothetical protein
MVWKKATDAAREWCGGVDEKTLYRAVKEGRLKAARIGAGRNLLFCEAWCDEWLTSSAATPREVAPTVDQVAALRRRA